MGSELIRIDAPGLPDLPPPPPRRKGAGAKRPVEPPKPLEAATNADVDIRTLDPSAVRIRRAVGRENGRSHPPPCGCAPGKWGSTCATCAGSGPAGHMSKRLTQFAPRAAWSPNAQANDERPELTLLPFLMLALEGDRRLPTGQRTF